MNAATKTLRTYSVTLPSGAVVTFNSSKNPSHAVVRTGHVREEWNAEGMISTHGTLKAALKNAQTKSGAQWGHLGVKVVECVAV